MRRRAILVAEDCADDRALLADALADCRCDVAMVGDGQKALEYLEGSGEYRDRRRSLPRLLLLDLKMPVKDGYETLGELRRRERWKLLPVVVLSSSAQPEDVERCYRLGANGYLVKPSELSELSAMMRAAVAFWLDFNQAPLLR